MAVENLAPESITGNANWTGTVSDINEAIPPGPDGNYIYTDVAGTQSFEIIFGTPSGNPDQTTNAQVLVWGVRKTNSAGTNDSGGSDPTWTIEISTDDGTEWSTLESQTIVGTLSSSTTPWTYPVGTGDPADGSQFRVRFSTTSNGGGPNRRWAALDVLEWRCEVPGATTPQAVSGSLTPAGALSSTKITQQAVSGSLTPAGALTTSRVTQQAVSGSITPAGALTAFEGNRNVEGSLTMSGYLYRWRKVSKVESVQQVSGHRYWMEVDGVAYPLTDLRIIRQAGTNSAEVGFPRTFEDSVRDSSPGALAIKQSAVIDGTPTTLTLYTGSITNAQIRQSGALVRAIFNDTPSYGSNASRELSNITYWRGGDSLQVRAELDHRFIPGDQVIVGDQVFDVDKVVLIVRNGARYMEVIRSG